MKRLVCITSVVIILFSLFVGSALAESEPENYTKGSSYSSPKITRYNIQGGICTYAIRKSDSSYYFGSQSNLGSLGSSSAWDFSYSDSSLYSAFGIVVGFADFEHYNTVLIHGSSVAISGTPVPNDLTVLSNSEYVLFSPQFTSPSALASYIANGLDWTYIAPESSPDPSPTPTDEGGGHSGTFNEYNYYNTPAPYETYRPDNGTQYNPPDISDFFISLSSFSRITNSLWSIFPYFTPMFILLLIVLYIKVVL